MQSASVDLRQFDLNLLVAFDALMTEGSVTRAAQRLSIGQSAMSATLTRLRRHLGDELFVRDGRGLMPTPVACSLQQPVRDVLANVAALLNQRRSFDPATAERTFTVMASDYVTVVFLTPLLQRLAREAPGVRLQVSAPAADFTERVRRNRVELAIMPVEAFGDLTGVRHEPLFSDRFLVAVDRANTTVGSKLSLEQFSTQPFLATTCGHHITPAEAQLDRMGIARNVEITTSFGLAPILLRGTNMIALVHERLAVSLRAETSIRLLDPPMDLAPINETLLWTDRAHTDPGHVWLRQRMLDLAAELDDEFRAALAAGETPTVRARSSRRESRPTRRPRRPEPSQD